MGDSARKKEDGGLRYQLDNMLDCESNVPGSSKMLDEKFGIQPWIFIVHPSKQVINSKLDLKKICTPHGKVVDIVIKSDFGLATVQIDRRVETPGGVKQVAGINLEEKKVIIKFETEGKMINGHVHTGTITSELVKKADLGGGRVLLVENLNPVVSSSLLRKAFTKFGKVEMTSIIVDSEGQSTTKGKVLFQSKTSALVAYQQIQLGNFFVGPEPKPITAKMMELENSSYELLVHELPKAEMTPRFAVKKSFEDAYADAWKKRYAQENEMRQKLEENIQNSRVQFETEMEECLKKKEVADLETATANSTIEEVTNTLSSTAKATPKANNSVGAASKRGYSEVTKTSSPAAKATPKAKNRVGAASKRGYSETSNTSLSTAKAATPKARNSVGAASKEIEGQRSIAELVYGKETGKKNKNVPVTAIADLKRQVKSRRVKEEAEQKAKRKAKEELKEKAEEEESEEDSIEELDAYVPDEAVAAEEEVGTSSRRKSARKRKAPKNDDYIVGDFNGEAKNSKKGEKESGEAVNEEEEKMETSNTKTSPNGNVPSTEGPRRKSGRKRKATKSDDGDADADSSDVTTVALREDKPAAPVTNHNILERALARIESHRAEAATNSAADAEMSEASSDQVTPDDASVQMIELISRRKSGRKRTPRKIGSYMEDNDDDDDDEKAKEEAPTTAPVPAIAAPAPVPAIAAPAPEPVPAIAAPAPEVTTTNGTVSVENYPSAEIIEIKDEEVEVEEDCCNLVEEILCRQCTVQCENGVDAAKSYFSGRGGEAQARVFLQDHGVLSKVIPTCPECNVECKYLRDDKSYACVRTVDGASVRCGHTVSEKKGTICQQTNPITYSKLLLFALYYSTTELSLNKVASNLDMTSQTVMEWRRTFGEVCISFVHNQPPIGGPDIELSIDEATIEEVNHNYWLFGGLELVSKKKFLVYVKGSRPRADRLSEIITKYVRKGSIVHTENNAGMGYKLSRLGYKYEIKYKAHQLSFVRNVPYAKTFLRYKIARYIFVNSFDDAAMRFHYFLTEIAKLYPRSPPPSP